MADLPRATVTQAVQGGGVGNGSELLCIMSPVSSGVVATPRLFTQVQDCLDTYGFHEGLDLAAHHVEVNKLPFLHVGLTIAQAAALGPVNIEGVTGSSTVSFSGTPKDDEDIWILIDTGGTVGTDGILFQVSRDGGRVYGGKLRLGTATSYEIPRTGITVAFSVGALVAGDIAKARCVAPTYDAAGLLAAFTALAATSHLPRVIHLCGDIDTTTEVQDAIDRINAYETTNQRHSRIMCSARQRFADCAMAHTKGTFKRAGITPADVDFDAAGDTITRDTGSWIDDGFAVGQSVTVSGAAQAGNNAVHGVISTLSATVMTLPASPGLTAESNTPGSQLTITGVGPGDLDFTATTVTRNTGSFVTDGFKVGQTVTIAGTVSNNFSAVLTVVSATVLTFASGGVTESNKSGSGVTITGTETTTTWKSAIQTIVGATPQTEKVGHRVSLWAGRARRGSPIDGSRRRRPASWAAALRIMGHDLHVSAAQMDLLGLEGWSITDNNGILEDHDERVHGGLLPMRVACLTTSDDLAGVFVALPVTLDTDNAPLSRLQSGLVCDLACRIAKRETTLKLGSNIVLNTSTGFIREADRKLVEKTVTNVLKSALLVPGAEGPKASGVSFTMAGGIDMRTPGTQVPCEVIVTTLGYFEDIKTTVRVAVGG